MTKVAEHLDRNTARADVSAVTLPPWREVIRENDSEHIEVVREVIQNEHIEVVEQRPDSQTVRDNMTPEDMTRSQEHASRLDHTQDRPGSSDKPSSAPMARTSRRRFHVAPRDLENDWDSMTDDPRVANYAHRTVGAYDLFHTPAFQGFHVPTRDLEQIQHNIRDIILTRRNAHHSRVIMHDGSGMERLERERLENSVKPDIDKQLYMAAELGDQVIIGPAGSTTRISDIGQRVGARLMAKDERKKCKKGELNSSAEVSFRCLATFETLALADFNLEQRLEAAFLEELIEHCDDPLWINKFAQGLSPEVRDSIYSLCAHLRSGDRPTRDLFFRPCLWSFPEERARPDFCEWLE